jgi:hypothetical protein
MAVAVTHSPTHKNPLDRVERLAESRAWHIDRTNDHEVVMLVGGGWADLSISLTWRDDMESLHCAVTPDLKVPEKRREEVARLLSLINAQLMLGHFDVWADGSVLYRNALLLTGQAEANDAQCESLIHLGLETVQTYYPAFQFVIWAGHSAEEALDSALLETMGEA